MNQEERSEIPMVSSHGSLVSEVPFHLGVSFRSTSNGTSMNSASLMELGQWLLSISAAEDQHLQETPAYRDVVRAIHNLQRRYLQQRLEQDVGHYSITSNGRCFLQREAAEEILDFILNFLEARSLACLAATCARFRILVPRHATQRAQAQQQQDQEIRQLSNPIQLVRVYEQIRGLFPFHPHVRLPVLLLHRPILLTDCGDEEYNGVYFCTRINGNGFVFTKPRTLVPPLSQSVTRFPTHDFDMLDPARPTKQSESAGYQLQCIISKRFSSDTLLWYCCKEVLVTFNSEETFATEVSEIDSTNDTLPVTIVQRYAFWARISMLGEGSDYDLCRYPSQTSVLRRQGLPGWQSLANPDHLHPPTVELLDT